MNQSDLTTKVRDAAHEALANSLDQSAVRILSVVSDSVHRPSLALLHPSLGLVAVEVGRPQESEIDTRTRLNDKVQRLLREASFVSDHDVYRVSVVADSNIPVKRIGPRAVLVGEHHLSEVDWCSRVREKSSAEFDFERLSSLLNPRFVIDIPTYSGVEDTKYEERRAVRVKLDREQSEIAARSIDDILVVSGGPGTGKTMVLLGRAKWLAEQHPDWRILLVVYNNMLLKHLRAIPNMPDSVKIVSLKKFLEVRGEKSLSKLLTNFDDPDGAEEQAAQILRSMKFENDDVDFDALLVDEWQDFRSPYIQFLLSVLRRGRGGAMFAGDEKQAIYTDGYPSAFKGRDVESVSLSRPYRSTQQILAVATALDTSYEIEHIDQAPSGEPVTLIHAPHWSTQGEAIAVEIRQLLSQGQVAPGRIAVLCTTKSGANHVASALEEKSIPFKLLTKYWENPEPGSDVVNVMTIHGGKGQGFEVVFVQGFETLKDFDGTSEVDKWRRVGFVGVTRAEDLLFIVYRYTTQFISSVLELGARSNRLVVSRVFPDDYKKLL